MTDPQEIVVLTAETIEDIQIQNALQRIEAANKELAEAVADFDRLLTESLGSTCGTA